MREATGNLWECPCDAMVVTTNGTVTKNGAVMGAGCALEAKERFHDIEYFLGRLIRDHGNHVYWLAQVNPHLFSFPVKNDVREKADLQLIEQSAHELVEHVSGEFWDQGRTILVPRPGCGYGGLTWEQVKPILEPIFDDRFVVITFDPLTEASMVEAASRWEKEKLDGETDRVS